MAKSEDNRSSGRGQGMQLVKIWLHSHWQWKGLVALFSTSGRFGKAAFCPELSSSQLNSVFHRLQMSVRFSYTSAFTGYIKTLAVGKDCPPPPT